MAAKVETLTLVDSLLVFNSELFDDIEDSSDEDNSGDARETSSRSPDLALTDPMRDVQARFELVALRFDAVCEKKTVSKSQRRRDERLTVSFERNDRRD